MGSSVPIQTSKLKYWWICVVRFELLPQNIIKMIKALVGLALVAAVAGIPAGPPPPPYHAPAPAYKPAPYGKPKLPPQPFAYEYGVKDGYSGADFAKNENQDASGNVAGSYVVHLPDGRVQTVTYTADHYNGFVADVKYEGVPQYPPEPKGGYGPHPAPAYKPAPVYKPAA